ncbi:MULTISPECIES: molybdopterin converting factor subunit 1 [Rufibacter]|uniref:Molybdopterin synthase sulfur carrier subunit n=1 Tax=Rufibacter quisquiliarum TaxID=1549639 RepID=A0A839GLS2_9BACT|nr:MULTISPECIES: molybdopterin converting factor subunit 1 [Rufibacter]MBA9078773.1 molybdopterin synthase sulfur carrier subunit [Rufibacter quisquiliarum]
MNILLFGITRDIVGASHLQVEPAERPKTVGQLKQWLAGQYPELKNLSSLAVAVDSEYAEDDALLSPHQEIALIPPVSGG